MQESTVDNLNFYTFDKVLLKAMCKRQRNPLSCHIFLLFLLFDLNLCVCINPNCDFYQDVALGQEYFIYNQEYPYYYRSSTSCRWSARSLPGTVIVVSCTDINIPSSQNCQNDKLAISLTGNVNFNDSRNFCGENTFTIFSEQNFITVGLFSGTQTSGGRFLCSLAAVRVAPRWCNCGHKIINNEETKIVGGQETKVNEFPWMAALRDLTRGEAFCGANIISERHALTAAHCLLNQSPQNVRLLVGDHNLDTVNDTPAAALYPLIRFTSHPMFDSRDESNDIAVVTTDRRIQFNAAVAPVCLPFIYGMKNFVNNIVTVLGWGFKDFSGDKSSTLQKVNLSIVSNNYCAQATRQQIKSTQICTYAPGKDSCISDSGGPLLWRHSRRRKFELVGIISFGFACATTIPAINTRVTSFLAWIASVTSDASYCLK